VVDSAATVLPSTSAASSSRRGRIGRRGIQPVSYGEDSHDDETATKTKSWSPFPVFELEEVSEHAREVFQMLVTHVRLGARSGQERCRIAPRVPRNQFTKQHSFFRYLPPGEREPPPQSAAEGRLAEDPVCLGEATWRLPVPDGCVALAGAGGFPGPESQHLSVSTLAGKRIGPGGAEQRSQCGRGCREADADQPQRWLLLLRSKLVLLLLLLFKITPRFCLFSSRRFCLQHVVGYQPRSVHSFLCSSCRRSATAAMSFW